MRIASTIVLIISVLAGIGMRVRAADERPAEPRAEVVVAAPIEPTGPQIALQLIVSEMEEGQRRILARPQVRMIAGQQAVVDIGGSERSLRIDLVASVEPAPLEAAPALRGSKAKDKARPVAGTPIHVKFAVVERDGGERRLRSQGHVRMLAGEPASVRTGTFELELAARLIPEVQHASDEDETDRAELRIYRALQKRISVDFDGVPLAEAIKQVAARAAINIVVDRNALEDVGRPADTKVTLSTEGTDGIRLSTLLDRIVEPLGLDYVVADEVLQITSIRRTRGAVASYPIGDLLPKGENRVDVLVSAGQDLVERITQSISPATWETAGGRGTARIVWPWRILVIRQAPDVQERIASLLQRIRDERKAAGEP